MANSDVDTPAKVAKASSGHPPSSAPSSGAVYPDWSGFQAYSPIPPHGFFPSSVVSDPQAHPYIWGAQHMMSPYGTPPRPYVMYPHGGLYAHHPSIPPGTHPFGPYIMPSPNGNLETSGTALDGPEVDGKSVEGKEKKHMKRLKGSLGSLNMITGKNCDELGKPGVPANGVFSQRVEGRGEGESGSEDSSEGSDNNSQNDSQPKVGVQGSYIDNQTENGPFPHNSQNGGTHTPPSQPMLEAGSPAGVAAPTANLNICIDYWGAPNPCPIVPISGKGYGATGVGEPRESIPSDHWLQDEREIKRQKRKQSNRDSARRSRLRKQADCEEFAQRVEVLKEENSALQAELSRVTKEWQRLVSDNTSLTEKIKIHRRTDDPGVERRGDCGPGDDDNHQEYLYTDTDAADGQAVTVRNGS